MGNWGSGFDLDNVKVEVSSSGPCFTVRLQSPDQKTAKELLRSAMLLAQP
jgi:hypothetical protein